jgi:hypothetical protein
LSLQTHMEWCPYPLHTHKVVFIIQCYGLTDKDPPSCQFHHTVCPDHLQTYPTSFDAVGLLKIIWCSGCGSGPTWNGSHIHMIHIQGVWHHSSAMDWQMDPPSCHYHHACLPRFANLSKFVWRSWGSNDIMVEWLRLQAPDPHRIVHKSTAYIYKVFDTIQMLWIDREGSTVMSVPPCLPRFANSSKLLWPLAQLGC